MAERVAPEQVRTDDDGTLSGAYRRIKGRLRHLSLQRLGRTSHTGGCMRSCVRQQMLVPRRFTALCHVHSQHGPELSEHETAPSPDPTGEGPWGLEGRQGVTGARSQAAGMTDLGMGAWGVGKGNCLA